MMLRIPFRVTLGLALLSVIKSVAVNAQAQQERPFGPAEARAVGRAIRDEEVRRYGLVANAAWNQDIRYVLARLQRASGYPGLHIEFVVVGNTKMNAAATPGSGIVINAGLMRTLHQIASRAGETPDEVRNRYVGYLAAVLGHELAHLTLGHTDSSLVRVRRLAEAAGVPDSEQSDAGAYRHLLEDSAPSLEELHASRERELDADAAGALYLLRAGWTIQTAMDLLREFDAIERTDSSFYQTVTAIRTHPRASYREASLEELRARLVAQQANFDDALALISYNTRLDAAITLLDSVLSYFPDLTPALHARGTAYHELWLETVPVATQQVRASLRTFAIRFLPTIRGAPGDLRLYAAARRDYLAVLGREALPQTASQLALLEAYSGDCASAAQRAQDAATASAQSPDVVNNLGVVMFVCSRPADALAAFQRAQRLAGPASVPTLVFNTARALQASGSSEAGPLFRQYLTLDPSSQWSREARRSLGFGQAEPPPSTGSAPVGRPPRIQGVGLGDTYAAVYALWGAPASVQGDSATPLIRYPGRGVALVVNRAQGVVTLIYLGTRDAGVVNGIRVGDQVDFARSLFGLPVEQNEQALVFSRGSWVIAVYPSGPRIAALAFGLND